MTHTEDTISKLLIAQPWQETKPSLVSPKGSWMCCCFLCTDWLTGTINSCVTRDIKATALSHPWAFINPMLLTEKAGKNTGPPILGFMSREQKSLCRKSCCQLMLYFYFFILVEGIFHWNNPWKLLIQGNYPWCAIWTWGKMLLPVFPSQCLIFPLPPQSDAPAKSAECVFTALLTGVKYEANVSQILPAGWPTTSKSLLFTADLIRERWGTCLEFQLSFSEMRSGALKNDSKKTQGTPLEVAHECCQLGKGQHWMKSGLEESSVNAFPRKLEGGKSYLLRCS